MITFWGSVSIIIFSSFILLLILYLSSKSKLSHWDVSFFMVMFYVMIFRLALPLEINLVKTFHSNYILVNINNLLEVQIFSRISVLQFITFVWLIGICFLLIRFIMQTYKTYMIFRVCTKLSVDSNIISKIRKQFPKIKKVRVITSSLTTVPMVYGFFKPTIIIPNRHFTNEELLFILRHELTHVARYHVWIKMMVELIYIFYWWNPLLSYTRRRVSELLEKETDLYIIKNESRKYALDYTEFLLVTYKEQLALYSFENNVHGKSPLISEFVNTDYTAEFYSRCRTIVFHNSNKKASFFELCKFFVLFVFIFAVSTIVIQPEYEVPYNPDFVEVTKHNSYLKPTKSGYDLYCNNEHIDSIDKNRAGYEYLPIKK